MTRFRAEIATYSYDALNRRTKRTVGDRDATTVWNGWQAIEEHAEGGVDERKVYGLGLDEVVERSKANGAGGFDRYALLYSTTGEPVAQLAVNGRPVERYAQSALGERKVYVDAERPAATQVAAKPGGIRIELSEQVQEPAEAAGASTFLRAQAQGFSLTETATGAPIEIEAKLAPEPGPGLERRRLEINVPNPPPAGTQVKLSLSPQALEDFFANRPDDMSEWTFAWPAEGISIVEDTAPPELVRALLKDGKVEATFSKEVTAAGLGDAASIDNASVEWTVSPDGRVATTSTVLPGGIHRVEFGTDPIDLAGKGLASPIAVDLTVPAGERRDLAGLVVLLFELLNQRELAQSPTGQQASFQGHPVDPETGFVYLRNRYFDPELGRFITADPMGYPDGPSDYAFGAGDVVNGRDPMGMANATSGVSIPKSNFALSDAEKRSARFLRDEALAGPRLVERIPAIVASVPRASHAAFDHVAAGSEFVGRCGANPGACAELTSDAFSNTPRWLEKQWDAFVDAPLDEHAQAWGDALYGLFLGGAPYTRAATNVEIQALKIPKGMSPAQRPGQAFFDDLARLSTRNSESSRVVLGKWQQDGRSYTKVAAHYRATYFKATNWRELAKTLTREEIWEINKSFLRQQIKSGKQTILSHDPVTATGYFLRETQYLEDVGFHFVKEGWIWRAVR